VPLAACPSSDFHFATMPRTATVDHRQSLPVRAPSGRSQALRLAGISTKRRRAPFACSAAIWTKPRLKSTSETNGFICAHRVDGGQVTLVRVSGNLVRRCGDLVHLGVARWNLNQNCTGCNHRSIPFNSTGIWFRQPTKPESNRFGLSASPTQLVRSALSARTDVFGRMP